MKKASVATCIGTAGWTVPSQLKERFPGKGTHLERYSKVLNCVEINSSFYRNHRPESYAKWGRSTPEDFLFSVKLSRYFTQETRLKEAGARLQEVLDGISLLGRKWGVLLVQLPPSLVFDRGDVSRFLKALRKIYSGNLAWEPRHLSWVDDRVVDLLRDYEVTKVIADPERCPWTLEQRARCNSFEYYRLHGSPEIYKSQYSAEFLERLAAELNQSRHEGKSAWCIFDNTTFGYATEDALKLRAGMSELRGRRAS